MAKNVPIRDEFLEELEHLRRENDRLKLLLSANGVNWEIKKFTEAQRQGSQLSAIETPRRQFTRSEKIALFRRLFHGRTDVYPVRWESTKGKSGYSPACSNEWLPGVCKKPRIKCSDCNQRLLLPVTDQVIYDHLSGQRTIGVYPLLPDDTCFFLATDFDGASWKEDSLAFLRSCQELEVPATLEISRSGKGAHVWIFFAEAVSAREARQLGEALISHACARIRLLSLASYDRFFPNQDTLPKGGFGNLIALPLQKIPRENGCSVFVNEDFEPHTDQWAHLASLNVMSRFELERSILRATGGGLAIDIASVADNTEPWKRPAPSSVRIPEPLPESLTLVLANQIFIAKEVLPQPLANRLIRLAAFQNPEFYKAQSMRLPVWNTPRIIGCAENFPHHIGLPRGCLQVVQDLLAQNNIQAEIRDERVTGSEVTAKFTGVLRADQEKAVKAILKWDLGVLCAPAAFGKTVTAVALIARRKVSTLILVHRTELLRQWQERLMTFLDLPKGTLGVIGGGKKEPSGKIDIAVMQSLSRQENLAELLDHYGQVIVDECHHLSAFSFEAILKQVKAKYVTGLTATPIRRDGHHPIILMQCGPIRHRVEQMEGAPAQLEVWPQNLSAPEIPSEARIQDVFRILANDACRSTRIAKDISDAYGEGRKIIVLTERTEHLDRLRDALGDSIEHCFVLHGRLSKKQRTVIFAELAGLDDSVPRVILATGRLIGEGFDYPPLDTLVLAMPISWKGTLQQYAGRLHRVHTDKKDVRIYDYVEHNNSQLARMWDKRQRGYRAMGYTIVAEKRTVLP